MSHSSSLAVLINEGFKITKLESKQLNAVAVSKGPGSYTGLRIGVSTAKGICYGAGIPLIAVPTLDIMAIGVILEKITGEEIENSLLCPMIDARRMEVYNALYNNIGKRQTEITADIIDEKSYFDALNKQKVYFFGDGAEKCKDVIKHENAIFLENVYPSAKYMLQIANQHFNEQQFEDVAYFEPFYLKDFIATIPKKNIYR